jgi:hypothetical protein
MIDLPNGWRVTCFLEKGLNSYSVTIKKNELFRVFFGSTIEQIKNEALIHCTNVKVRGSKYIDILIAIKNGEPYYTPDLSKANYIRYLSRKYGHVVTLKEIIKQDIIQYRITTRCL